MLKSENQLLQIPQNLLKKTIIQNKDVMGTKFNYEKSVGNEYLKIEPGIVKFTGFEVDKLNVLKINVQNTSQYPQRIQILPTSTPFFQLKFEKKGSLACGMSQEIFIYFKPKEYKYYFDGIKIHTEHEDFLIPIHAYPVLNRENLRDLFPKLIDFGTVDIGQTKQMVFPLVCKIPINFEYEFSYVNENSDICIEPMQGIIPAKSQTNITISYNPTQNITLIVKVELKISQFDFEPLLIKIMGTGRVSKLNSSQQVTKLSRPNSNIKLQSIENFKQTLNDSSLQEEKKGETAPMINLLQSKKASAKKNKQSDVKQDDDDDSFESTKKKTLNPRQQKEKNFLDKCNQVTTLDKDKEIKFFQALGDPEITDEQIETIDNDRNDFQNDFLKRMEDQGIHRYKLQLQKDLPVIDQTVVVNECLWDENKNNKIKRKRQILNALVKIGTKLIVQMRAQIRLNKIKLILKDCKNREQVKAMVKQDWFKAESQGIGKKNFTKFNFEMNEDNIGDLFIITHNQQVQKL